MACKNCGHEAHPEEVVVTTNDGRHWLWRAVDQHGVTLDVLVQSRRDRHAARRLMCKHSRYNRDAAAKRAASTQALPAWGRASGARTFGVTAM